MFSNNFSSPQSIELKWMCATNYKWSCIKCMDEYFGSELTQEERAKWVKLIKWKYNCAMCYSLGFEYFLKTL